MKEFIIALLVGSVMACLWSMTASLHTIAHKIPDFSGNTINIKYQ